MKQIIPTFQKLTTTGNPPSERSTPAVAALHQDIYFFGGVKDDFKTGETFYNDFYIFNTQTNHWKQLSLNGELPPPRGFGPVAFSYQETIILYGGLSYGPKFSNLAMYTDFWSYSVSHNRWTKLEVKNQGPSIRSNSRVWLKDNYIYVFGGEDPKVTKINDLWVFDLTNNVWKELIPDQSPGSPIIAHETSSGTTSNDSKLIFYGCEFFSNEDKTKFELLNDVWEFNLSTNQWKKITPEKNIFPPRTNAATVVIEDALYLQGGNLIGAGYITECNAKFPQSVTDEMWKFDTTNNEWSKLGVAGDPLPRLKRSSSAVVDNKMYIFSGFDFQCYGDGPGQIWNKEVYCFNPKGLII